MRQRRPNLPFVEAQMIETRRKFGVVHVWLFLLTLALIGLAVFVALNTVKVGKTYEFVFTEKH